MIELTKKQLNLVVKALGTFSGYVEAEGLPINAQCVKNFDRKKHKQFQEEIQELIHLFAWEFASRRMKIL